MTTIATQTRFTPSDILRLEDEGLYELVDGRLVEKPVSSLASKCAGIIIVRLGNFMEPDAVGEIYPEQSFQCFPSDANLIRRPDVAVILASRLADVSEEGHVKVAPDLAIEVLSPSDKFYELEEKLADYRSAGVKLVWVVNPKARVMQVYPLGRSNFGLEEADTVNGGEVLPGFAMPLRELLPPIPAARS